MTQKDVFQKKIFRRPISTWKHCQQGNTTGKFKLKQLRYTYP